MTSERWSLLRAIYDLYCEHVKTETHELATERGYSLTWAMNEATWLMDPLLPSPFRPGRALEPHSLLEACAEVPSIALEEKDSRVGISAQALSAYESFWTVESAFFSSAETLLKEIPTSASLSRLSANIDPASFQLPEGPYVPVQRPRSISQRLAFRDREVDRIVLRRDRRRIDLRWANRANPPLWRSAEPVNADVRQLLLQAFQLFGGTHPSGALNDLFIGNHSIECDGVDGETSISSLGRTWVLPGSELSSYLLKLLDRLNESPDAASIARYVIALQTASFSAPLPNAEEFISQQLAVMSRLPQIGAVSALEDTELVAVLQTTPFKSFNLLAWARGDQP
jgi:hypothetical protein